MCCLLDYLEWCRYCHIGIIEVDAVYAVGIVDVAILSTTNRTKKESAIILLFPSSSPTSSSFLNNLIVTLLFCQDWGMIWIPHVLNASYWIAKLLNIAIIACLCKIRKVFVSFLLSLHQSSFIIIAIIINQLQSASLSSMYICVATMCSTRW